MFNIETVSLIITITLALIGYFVTYFNNLALSRRTERLELITKQLHELYGPMYVITRTGSILFEAFRAKTSFQNQIAVDYDSPQNTDELSEWRIWVNDVFMPLNNQLEEVIIQKAHLIREEEMPTCLLKFVAHHAGYKAVISKWNNGDFSESVSIISFPMEINEYAKKSYQELKAEQLKIIAMKKKVASQGCSVLTYFQHKILY